MQKRIEGNHVWKPYSVCRRTNSLEFTVR